MYCIRLKKAVPEAETIEETEEKAEEEETKYQIFFEAGEHGMILAEAEGAEKAASFMQEVEKAEELVSVTAEAEEG